MFSFYHSIFVEIAVGMLLTAIAIEVDCALFITANDPASRCGGLPEFPGRGHSEAKQACRAFANNRFVKLNPNELKVIVTESIGLWKPGNIPKCWVFPKTICVRGVNCCVVIDENNYIGMKK
jgi:hypothetical protein